MEKDFFTRYNMDLHYGGGGRSRAKSLPPPPPRSARPPPLYLPMGIMAPRALPPAGASVMPFPAPYSTGPPAWPTFSPPSMTLSCFPTPAAPAASSWTPAFTAGFPPPAPPAAPYGMPHPLVTVVTAPYPPLQYGAPTFSRGRSLSMGPMGPTSARVVQGPSYHNPAYQIPRLMMHHGLD